MSSFVSSAVSDLVKIRDDESSTPSTLGGVPVILTNPVGCWENQNLLLVTLSKNTNLRFRIIS